MKVIGVCTQKGGVSKSTTCVELGAILAEKNRRVLVLDLDQQCSLTKNVKADLNAKSIYDVLHCECTIKEAIQHNDLFDIIPGSESLSRAEREFIEDEDNFLLSDMMHLVEQDYDYVFIDNAPSRNKLLTMTYIASDYIIIPTMCDESSLDAVVTTEKDIEKLVYGRHHDSHAEVLGYILSFYERTIMHQLAIESLNRLAAKKEKEPFVMTVSKSIKLSEVKTMHTALCKSDKSCKPAWDYLQIVEEIIHRVEE